MVCFTFFRQRLTEFYFFIDFFYKATMLTNLSVCPSDRGRDGQVREGRGVGDLRDLPVTGPARGPEVSCPQHGDD